MTYLGGGGGDGVVVWWLGLRYNVKVTQKLKRLHFF